MPPDTFTDFAVHVAPTADGGTNVTIYGELDLATVDQVTKALAPVLERTGYVELDLRACPFVDSTGIAAIARAALRLREQERTLRLIGVQERVRRILDIAGLTKSDLMEVEERPKPAKS